MCVPSHDDKYRVTKDDKLRLTSLQCLLKDAKAFFGRVLVILKFFLNFIPDGIFISDQRFRFVTQNCRVFEHLVGIALQRRK